MQRENIRLLARAKAGDIEARFIVGRCYLRGEGGFPRHPQVGLGYLQHPSLSHRQDVCDLVATALSLHEVITLRCLQHLSGAATPLAMGKLNAWRFLRDSARPAERWHSVASDAGCNSEDAASLALMSARAALDEGDIRSAMHALACAASVHGPDDAGAELLIQVLRKRRDASCDLPSTPAPAWVEAALELRISGGDAFAAYVLGLALCGVDEGIVPPPCVVGGQNLRMGSALLLRAADGGCVDAWMHLWRVHSDARSSVSNARLALFCLEKAARAGIPEAQRRLGASLLRKAVSLRTSIQAIEWLHRAMLAGDEHAPGLLRSLVLPVSGSDDAAALGLRRLGADDPLMAARLRVARAFGLTRLEALSFDPVNGCRAWGLVVDRNPFVSQEKLGAPRAVPALGEEAMTALRVAASMYAGVGTTDGLLREGHLRRRTQALRRAFDRHALDERWYFAEISSAGLQALRVGHKWAYRSQSLLRSALVD